MKTNTANEICPICGKFQFTQEYLDKNEINIDDVFDCPVCGGEVVYVVLCRMEEDMEEYIAIYNNAELI